MLLDNGIVYIYRVDRRRGLQTPADGLAAIYRDWHGQLHHESGKGAEAGDMIRRIRIHDADVREYDTRRAHDGASGPHAHCRPVHTGD